MDALTQAKFKPYEAPTSRDFSQAPVSNLATKPALDSTDKDKINFADLVGNSNEDMARTRAAQKNGAQGQMAKTNEEFAKMMMDKANQGNMRKPQNELDKDAFLKLFVTQMRNQDPLNPDNSSEMASQLAQFHGLEQMMNVNKNLEKMQNDEAMGRAVSLINFVGKDIKLDNGKLLVTNGKIATDAVAKVDGDANKATLEVRDAAGVVLGTKDLGHLSAGDHKFEDFDWHALTKDGKPINDGAYTFSINATNDRNEPVPVGITSSLKVTGVDLHDAGGSFYTALGKVRINDVSSVGTGGFVKETNAASATADDAKKKAAAETGKANEAVEGLKEAAKEAAANADMQATKLPAAMEIPIPENAQVKEPEKTEAQNKTELPAKSETPSAAKAATPTATPSAASAASGEQHEPVGSLIGPGGLSVPLTPHQS